MFTEPLYFVGITLTVSQLSLSEFEEYFNLSFPNPNIVLSFESDMPFTCKNLLTKGII